MKSYKVINWDFNSDESEAYDVMPYFIRKYNEAENKPKTFEEFKEFVNKNSMHQFWARCEYEIIITGWPRQKKKEKWDVDRQIRMNIDLVTKILMENVLENK